jgi:hypothetical protein
MDANRKALAAAYKQRTRQGGIYRILHLPSGRYALEATADLKAAENRFAFSQHTAACALGVLRADWLADGPKAFRFEALEELTSRPDQTPAEYREELATLLELWQERLPAELDMSRGGKG